MPACGRGAGRSLLFRYAFAALSGTLKLLPEGLRHNRSDNRRRASSRQHDKHAVGAKREGGLTGGEGERPDEAIKANVKQERREGKAVEC